MELTEARIIELPKITDLRGNLTAIQAPESVPFEIVRCYWVYDVPSGLSRDGHAYYKSHELIVALNGAFDVEVDNGRHVTTYRLQRPNQGLLVPAMHWRTIENFTTNGVAMVLSSTLYDIGDYILDYEKFKEIYG